MSADARSGIRSTSPDRGLERAVNHDVSLPGDRQVLQSRPSGTSARASHSRIIWFDGEPANGHQPPAGWWVATIAVPPPRAHAVSVAPLPIAARSYSAPGGPPAVRVIDEDPELLGGLGGTLAEAACHQLVARTLHLESGAWTPLENDLPLDFDGWLGMLVLEGLVVRQVDIDGLRCCELLGPGDVLRPWDEDGPGAALESSARWRILEPTRVALLDAGFGRRACRWPSVTAELMRRTLARSRSLSILLALTQARRADVRLRTLFWHLADRWGRVTPDGVLLPLNLTHRVIAELTGLRRPSVSLSLGELERTGEIVRLTKSSWLIASPGDGTATTGSGVGRCRDDVDGVRL